VRKTFVLSAKNDPAPAGVAFRAGVFVFSTDLCTGDAHSRVPSRP
jgi:hypothetical protein